MTANYTFDPGIVLNDTTNLPIANATGILAATVNGPAESIYTLGGSPIGNLITNENGYLARFKADIPIGYLNFGSVWQPVIAFELFQNAVDIGALIAAANASATSAAAAATAAQAAQAAAESAAAGTGLDEAAIDTYLGGDAQNLIKRVWGVREPTSATAYAALDSDFDHLLSYGQAPSAGGADPTDLRGGSITAAQFDIHERVETA